MIQSISITKIATFNELGIEIPAFKRINFIYGVNGSGKTTISNYIYEPENPKFANCRLKWFNDIALRSIVYNKEFRDRNFGKGTIAGVFTLGQATKEEAAVIELKKNELTELQEKGIHQKSVLDKQIAAKEQLENDFREEFWETIYKKNEITFKEAFKGVMQKKHFMQRIIEEFDSNIAAVKTLDELGERAETIFGEMPVKLNEMSIGDYTRIIELEENAIWRKKIIGKADVKIAELIQRLSINDWVNEGRSYLQRDETCPFCQQKTITEEFKEQLEGYFDEAFTNDTTKIKENIEEYLRLFENLINHLQQIDDGEKANKDSKLDRDKFSAFLKTLNSQFIGNKELLNSKAKEPSRSIELMATKEQLDEIALLIGSANSLIVKHNNIVTNYPSERAELIKDIWKLLVEENRIRIQHFMKHSTGLARGIENINKKLQKLRIAYKTLDSEIKTLTKNLTSIQPAVDEINKILLSFGFHNFKIASSKAGLNQYQIERENGELAEATLSEGEITFITFLYFLQHAKGGTSETDITEDRILVIDDPISSLDSTVLFVVSSLIKEIIKAVKGNKGNIKQVILLTHNVYFHKEVSFINGRTNGCTDSNFWILRRYENVSSIQDFQLVNPIQNSYELLWLELKDKAKNSGVTIQNTMRRILENYFKILGKYGDDDLMNKFENPQEKEICRSLISWINEGSHMIPDDLFVEMQNNTIDNYFKVFKSIFKETGHLEHFNMMMNEKTIS